MAIQPFRRVSLPFLSFNDISKLFFFSIRVKTNDNHPICTEILTAGIDSYWVRMAENQEFRSRSISGGSGSDPSKIKRPRLQVNIQKVDDDFITTISKIFIYILFRLLGNITAANCTEELLLRVNLNVI